ncbi:MAG: phosphoribosylanthranilate isomerase [Bacteroidota bacterium]
MKLKVCGMREQGNIEGLMALRPDYMGLIFFAKSPRNVDESLDAAWVKAQAMEKVGVFVNADLGTIEGKIRDYGLNLAQLHGKESPEFCAAVRNLGVQVIKVFSVGQAFDFAQLTAYETVVDFFLFDTKGKAPGGNGVVFNWELLEAYPSKVPFFLSGGINPDNVAQIEAHRFPQLHAIDVNSGFEIRPGYKDLTLLQSLTENL